MKRITLKWLIRRGACEKAVEFFKKIFGDEASQKDIIEKLHELGKEDWEVWLMTRCCKLTISLLGVGANPNIKRGRVMHWAVFGGYLGVTRALVDAGLNRKNMIVGSMYATILPDYPHTRIKRFLEKSYLALDEKMRQIAGCDR